VSVAAGTVLDSKQASIGVVPMLQRRVGVDEPLPLAIVRTGDVPVRQGESCRALWVVQAGLLRASAVSDDGRVLALDLLGPGDAVGEPDGAPSSWSVSALRASRLRPVRGASAIRPLAARAHRLSTLASDLAWVGVSTRVERRLRDLATRFGRPVPYGVLIPIRLTQEDLAALAGTTRESANRAVRGLIERGRVDVERRGRYVVRPPLRLVRP
jgi:CRP/FNR family transcriptional regulator, cyclic AMP receptor protein